MPKLAPAETRTLINNVRWETYVALCEDRQGTIPRMSYADGLLELMSPKKEHEIVKTLLGRLIIAYCDHHEIEIESVASTTFRRSDIKRGFEADESYYIQNAEAIRTKIEIDLSADPPPDLVIAVEITSPLLTKMDLYQQMEIPEVWRHDGRSLTAHRLMGHQYQVIGESVALPGFPIALTQSLLNERLIKSQSAIAKEFRAGLASR